MAGPMLGMLGKATGAMLATQVGAGARRAGRRGAHRLRHRAAARPGRQGGAGAGQRRGVRRGARRHRGRRPALPRAARGRPPAALRPRAVAARAPHPAPWPTTPAASRSTPPASRSRCAASTRRTRRPSRRPCSRASSSRRTHRPSRRRSVAWRSTLALVEGWVDEVVGQATAERMPAATKLPEAVRRRRATGGPAEQTFASLVGLELRPRRLRDASTLWGSLRTRQGDRGPRRGLDAPRPAADRRPTSTTRSASARTPAPPTELSADEFDAELPAPARGRPRRRGRVLRRALRGVSGCPPRRRPHRAPGLAPARAPPGRAARPLRLASRGAPRRAGTRLPAATTSPPGRSCSPPTAGRCC